ncbi:MAG TPA: bifunctional nuclease family protein, partial [Planctomycetes bacterium]|nr:bifunctional nuclease family protein [Planctomycetota bacterium]
LKNNTFYARLVLRRLDGAVVEVDSRASDALALSIQFQVPILASEQVVEAATKGF